MTPAQMRDRIFVARKRKNRDNKELLSLVNIAVNGNEEAWKRILRQWRDD